MNQISGENVFLEIIPPDDRLLHVPFVELILPDVNLLEGRLLLTPPAGLLEL